jgi:hypothetical protein
LLGLLILFISVYVLPEEHRHEKLVVTQAIQREELRKKIQFSKDNIQFIGTLPDGRKVYKASIPSEESIRNIDEKYNDNVYWVEGQGNTVSVNSIIPEQYGKFFSEYNKTKVYIK